MSVDGHRSAQRTDRDPDARQNPDDTHVGLSSGHLVQHADILAAIADVLGERPDGILENVQPLETQAERHVVSKSNTSIQPTETDVTAIR